MHANDIGYTISQLSDPTTTETLPTLSPRAVFGAFDAHLSLPIKLSGGYIVFVRNTELIFIKHRTSSSPVVSSILHLLGPFGGLLAAIGWLWELFENIVHGRKNLHKEDDLAGLDPYELLQSTPHNFKLHLSEIRSGSVHPRTFWSFSQGRAGRIDLVVRLGEHLRVEFAKAEELATALKLLKPLLGPAMEVNVLWNPVAQRFDPKKIRCVVCG